MKALNSVVLAFLMYVILNAGGSKLKRPRGVSIASRFLKIQLCDLSTVVAGCLASS